MKSQRGVTLISVTIYVIAMVVVVGVMATIGTFFFSNVKKANKSIDPITEYTKFNRIFSEEVNHRNLKIVDWDEENKLYVVFDNGVQYTYSPENKSIYKNKVKICKGVENCSFEYKIQGGKNAIIVTIQSGEKEKRTKYILKD